MLLGSVAQPAAPPLARRAIARASVLPPSSGSQLHAKLALLLSTLVSCDVLLAPGNESDGGLIDAYHVQLQAGQSVQDAFMGPGDDAFEEAHPMLPPLRWGACAGSARVREMCTRSRTGRKIAGAHLDAALSPKLRQVLLARLGALRWSRHDWGEAEHLPKAAAQVASALSQRRCSRSWSSRCAAS